MLKCKASLDVAFIVDSSGSLRSEYHKEKKFVKMMIESFGIGLSTTRAGIIIFSHIAQLSIKLSRYDSLTDFKAAIDALPLMGSRTRIDSALRLAQSAFFSQQNGGR